jgi:hypothetical protein
VRQRERDAGGGSSGDRVEEIKGRERDTALVRHTKKEGHRKVQRERQQETEGECRRGDREGKRAVNNVQTNILRIESTDL